MQFKFSTGLFESAVYALPSSPAWAVAEVSRAAAEVCREASTPGELAQAVASLRERGHWQHPRYPIRAERVPDPAAPLAECGWSDL